MFATPPPSRPLPCRRSHTGEKRFPCPYPGCAKAYAHRAGLNYHLAAAHTGERPFRCEATGCGATFPGASACKVHMQKHHPGVPISSLISAGGGNAHTHPVNKGSGGAGGGGAGNSGPAASASGRR